ncbi:putative P-loop containing nucleoside triphosphate hydrolase protein [Lyophyllum shimeji]|uniref:DNA 3'-5' helicase n=1 Tax=Lyophyllum shimeji TaxID=47721 RepID=A0A9P3Q2R5_LYOSH|nr:putative P-loop containing nucleoside triphosphate hydrolase protein [Lyophyllum shimeji]
MSHARQRSKSYDILEKARLEAAKTKSYASDQTRLELETLFRQRFGRDPYEWQVDVTEAILLGLDCVVIAGTGAGKTMPFMMPLLLDDNKCIMVISPLKVLQEDQAERFEKMKLSATAVNGDTWSQDLQQELEQNKYQAVLTSPEMCLEHEEFRKIVAGPTFSDRVCAVVIDEAHCISQWGGDFRKQYSVLSKLRSLFPPTIPFLATSATLPPAVLREVRSSLAIDSDTCFFINLGNDRPNIAYSAQSMKSSVDYEALRPLLARTCDPTSPNDLIKTIVFMNSIPATQITRRTIAAWFPPHLQNCVDCLHARRSPKAKRRSMRRFRQGKTRILIATEVAGMGADIPDIEQVIQFGVPSSLSVWIQRAGRAGRSPDINARAILLYEESMFKRKRKRKRKRSKRARRTADTDSDLTEDEVEFTEGGDDEMVLEGEGDDEMEEEGDDGPEAEGRDEMEVDDGGDNKGGLEAEPEEDDDDGKEWGKKVEEDLRRWIETNHCRRDVADTYFDNPPGRKQPTGPCCDNCSTTPTRPQPVKTVAERPSTPHSPASPPSSVHSTPSKTINANGKRPMQLPEDYVPAKRRGEHLKEARAALEAWRFKVKRSCYTPSPFTAAAILPDPVLKTLASNGAHSVEDILVLLNGTGWVFVKLDEKRRATEAKRLRDEQEREERRAEQERKRAEMKARKEAEKAEMKAQKEAEKAEKKARKEAEKAAKKVRKEAEEVEKKRRKAEEDAAKKEATPGRRHLQQSARAGRGLPLAGSSVFNIAPHTPLPQTSYLQESSPTTPSPSWLGHSQWTFSMFDMSPVEEQNTPLKKRQPAQDSVTEPPAAAISTPDPQNPSDPPRPPYPRPRPRKRQPDTTKPPASPSPES